MRRKKSPVRDALEIALAFAIAFLFYQFLIVTTGTQLPIVSVVSSSMYHTTGMEEWWEQSGDFYENLGIDRERFLGFKNFNGLSQGDLLFVIAPEDVSVGDIVIYQRNGNGFTIVHRVIEINGERLVTKGDNNAAADRPILQRDLQGKVVLTLPVLGYPRFLLHVVGV